MTQTVTLSLFRFDGLAARAWALSMMGAARFAMPRIPDLAFWKLCGSGTGEGFTPIPNTAVYAILCTWPDLDTARARISDADVFQKYRARAAENWTLFMSPTSARGTWSSVMPFDTSDDAQDGPIAALTRATVKPTVALKFWNRVPDISKVIGTDPNVMFKIGIGEVPLFHQVTFSVWPNAHSMANFARHDGPHADAIRAVRDGAWFKEELYARFHIQDEMGSWEGRAPRIASKDIAA